MRPTHRSMSRTLVLASVAVVSGLVGSAQAQVIDGSRDASYGAPLARQTVGTQFGDNSTGDPIIAGSGSELAAAYGRVEGGHLYLMLTGNLETNFNKLEIFFDTHAGGQNTLRGDNADIDFNGLNRMGTGGDNGNGGPLPGFKFDAGFEADYFLTTTGGNIGGGTYSFFANFADVRTLGGGNGFFIGGSGPATAPFGLLTSTNEGSGIQIGYNNSNTAGVPNFGSPVDNAALDAVTTGVEIKIPLSFLGDPTSNFRVMAFINGGGHDFASNQFLGGFGVSNGNLGEPRNVDLGLIDGDQFFTVPNQGNINQWGGGVSTDWNTSNNWTQELVPNAQGASANFNNVSAVSVSLNSDVVVNRLNLNQADVNVSGTGVLTIGGMNFDAVRSANGNHSVANPIVLSKNTLVTVSSGSLKLSGQIAYNDRYVEKQGAGVLEVSNVRTNTLAVYAGSVKVSTNGTAAGASKLNNLITVSGANVDLTNNGLVIDYTGASVAGDYVNKILAGELISSLGSNYGVGVIDNAALATPLAEFLGQTLDASSLLIRGTRLGDSDLNGLVDFNDLVALARNYNPAGTGKNWIDGDSNYDGKVDFTDLVALARNYNLSSADEAALAAVGGEAFMSDFALAMSLVPEPATLGLLAGVAGMSLARRRR